MNSYVQYMLAFLVVTFLVTFVVIFARGYSRKRCPYCRKQGREIERITHEEKEPRSECISTYFTNTICRTTTITYKCKSCSKTWDRKTHKKFERDKANLEEKYDNYGYHTGHTWQ